MNFVHASSPSSNTLVFIRSLPDLLYSFILHPPPLPFLQSCDPRVPSFFKIFFLFCAFNKQFTPHHHRTRINVRFYPFLISTLLIQQTPTSTSYCTLFLQPSYNSRVPNVFIFFFLVSADSMYPIFRAFNHHFPYLRLRTMFGLFLPSFLHLNVT